MSSVELAVPWQQEVLGPSPTHEQSLGRDAPMPSKLGSSKGPFFPAVGLRWGRNGAAALTLEKHDWPSVPASALRLSWFRLLTSWDYPLSLSWLLGRQGPFFLHCSPCGSGGGPWWPLRPFCCPCTSHAPFLCQSSPYPPTGAHRDFKETPGETPGIGPVRHPVLLRPLPTLWAGISLHTLW